MIDDPAQLHLIDEARRDGTEVVRVCLELDTSLKLLGGRVRVGGAALAAALARPGRRPGPRRGPPARVQAGGDHGVRGARGGCR